MIRSIIFCLIFLINGSVVFSQTVEVKVATSKKEADAILKKAREETRLNKLYYAEAEKCRQLIGSRNFAQAEHSCRLAISLVEKLPDDQLLAKSSSHVALAVVMLWQKKPNEAISLLTKSLEIAKTIIDETDAETGERYFLIGQAYHQLANIDEAKKYYLKAENTYRKAFNEMGDSDIREFYPKPIINILEAHLFLLKNAGLTDEAERIEKRLAKTKIEFAEFLKN